MVQLRKKEGENLPLISISLASDQSLNILLISSCTMSDTVEPFPIVLKCMCVLLGGKKDGKVISRIKIRL